MNQIACPLCGARYDEAEGRVCQAGCPLEHSCHLLRCPQCGYEAPAATRLTRWLSRWWRPSSDRGGQRG